jgi:hypothetical protein
MLLKVIAFVSLLIFMASAHSAVLNSGFTNCEKITKLFIGNFLAIDDEGKLIISPSTNLAKIDKGQNTFSLKVANLNSESCKHWKFFTNKLGQLTRLESISSPEKAYANCTVVFETTQDQCFVSQVGQRYHQKACLELANSEAAYPLLKHCGLLMKDGPIGLKQGPASYSVDEQKLAMLHASKAELIDVCSSAVAQIYFLTSVDHSHLGCREFSYLTDEYRSAHPMHETTRPGRLPASVPLEQSAPTVKSVPLK